MKVLYFTLFGLVLSFAKVGAQERGDRRNSDFRIESRNDGNNNGRRVEDVHNQQNTRFENNRPRNNSHKRNSLNNNRREPIRIQNHGYNHSYGKIVDKDIRGFDNYHYNKTNFYGKNGMYYKPHNKGYVRFMPPIGFSINVLPLGALTINTDSRSYYFYEGVYYQKNKRNYQVVEPPIGAYVYALPMGYERVEYRGQLFYEYAGILYEKALYRGEQAYQVVGYMG